MRLALDVNRYADFQRGVPEAVTVVRRAEEIILPFVVVGELRCGFRYGTLGRANERVLTRFVARERVSVLWADEATTHIYADLFVELRKAGTPIPTNDLWIAALVVQHDLVLFSQDKHFDHVPRLARL